MDEENGRIAFEAYRRDINGADPRPFPSWESLPAAMRKAWTAAARAVRELVQIEAQPDPDPDDVDTI